MLPAISCPKMEDIFTSGTLLPPSTDNSCSGHQRLSSHHKENFQFCSHSLFRLRKSVHEVGILCVRNEYYCFNNLTFFSFTSLSSFFVATLLSFFLSLYHHILVLIFVFLYHPPSYVSSLLLLILVGPFPTTHIYVTPAFVPSAYIHS